MHFYKPQRTLGKKGVKLAMARSNGKDGPDVVDVITVALAALILGILVFCVYHWAAHKPTKSVDVPMQPALRR